MSIHREVASLCQVGDEVELQYATGIVVAGRITELTVSRRRIRFLLDQCRAVCGSVAAPAPEEMRLTLYTALTELEIREAGVYLVSNRSSLKVCLHSQKAS